MSQQEQILDWLLAGKSLTPLLALERFKCFRLAARIHELRGVIQIKTERLRLPSGKSVAVYSIEGKKKASEVVL